MNPRERDLVLVGGGHSHVIALRMLAMRSLPGLRITLVSPDVYTPYSGMLPGLLAGRYSFDEIHIDLARLCRWSGARFIRASLVALDPERQLIHLDSGQPALEYDLLSLDTGSAPIEAPAEAGCHDRVTPVKPISSFYSRWHTFLATLETGAEPRLAVVGGGVGSVEIALAIAARLKASGMPSSRVELVTAAPHILQEYSSSARRLASRALDGFGIELHAQRRISRIAAVGDQVGLFAGEDWKQDYEHIFWCTAAGAPTWPADAGLDCDDKGFVAVNSYLQSCSHDNIFAAGDLATLVDDPRPKAGVFAVREGPFLAANLESRWRGEKLRAFRPQRQFLSLLACGDGTAVGNWKSLGFAGQWVWRWKDRIDRKFMRRFVDLPPRSMQDTPSSEDGLAPMFCGGCGAKLPADLLLETLESLADRYPTVLAEPASGDDALVIESCSGTQLQSVDVLRELVDDPFVMGQIAANHALSDLYAMAARPLSSQALVQLPHDAERIQRRDLQQLMAGALDVMQRADCLLLGGHSMAGAELSIGFVVNGQAIGEAIPKDGVQEGDQLLLCKPLGTGALFAAAAQLRLDSKYLPAAINSMLIPNAEAGAIAVEYGATALTDITGFGLAGHLLEMLRGGGRRASLKLDSIPVLAGVEDCHRSGIFSTAYPANSRASAAVMSVGNLGDDLRLPVLYDPQTSGGLLMTVPVGVAKECLRALRDAGYAEAACIGEVVAGEFGIDVS